VKGGEGWEEVEVGRGGKRGGELEMEGGRRRRGGGGGKKSKRNVGEKKLEGKGRRGGNRGRGRKM